MWQGKEAYDRQRSNKHFLHFWFLMSCFLTTSTDMQIYLSCRRSFRLCRTRPLHPNLFPAIGRISKKCRPVPVPYIAAFVWLWMGSFFSSAPGAEDLGLSLCGEAEWHTGMSGPLSPSLSVCSSRSACPAGTEPRSVTFPSSSPRALRGREKVRKKERKNENHKRHKKTESNRRKDRK